MDLPRFEQINAYQKLHPAAHLVLAAQAGIGAGSRSKSVPDEVLSESQLESLAASFPETPPSMRLKPQWPETRKLPLP